MKHLDEAEKEQFSKDIEASMVIKRVKVSRIERPLAARSQEKVRNKFKIKLPPINLKPVMAYPLDSKNKVILPRLDSYAKPLPIRKKLIPNLKLLHNSPSRTEVNPKTVKSKSNQTKLFSVAKGNNKELIKAIIEEREGWKYTNEQNIAYNFLWRQSNKKVQYCLHSNLTTQPRIVNHYENEAILSNKRNLVYTLGIHCQNKNIDLFSIIPFTVILNSINMANFESFCKIHDKLPESLEFPTPYGETFNLPGNALKRG